MPHRRRCCPSPPATLAEARAPVVKMAEMGDGSESDGDEEARGEICEIGLRFVIRRRGQASNRAGGPERPSQGAIRGLSFADYVD